MTVFFQNMSLDKLKNISTKTIGIELIFNIKKNRKQKLV